MYNLLFSLRMDKQYIKLIKYMGKELGENAQEKSSVA